MSGTNSDLHNQNVSSESSASSEPFFSENLIRYFIKHCPNAAAIYDRNMVCLACSDRYLLDYGVSEEQVLGINHYEVFPEIPKKWRDVHQRALHGFVEKNDQDWFKRLDGSTCYTSWECRPWYEKEGKIGGIILYSEVITEQVRILQEAKEKEERDKKQLEAVLSNMDSGVAAIDMTGHAIHVNDALARILGYKDKTELPLDTDLFKSHFRLYTYPGKEDIPVEKWPLKRLYRGEIVGNEKYILRRLETGQERVIEYFGTPIRNTKGDPELELLIMTDITERQQAEEDLRKTKEFAEQEQAKWRAILDHVSNGVAVFDAAGNQIYANGTHAEIYGFEKEDKTPRNCLNSEFVVSRFAVQTYPDYRELKANEWPSSRVLAGEHLDGEIIDVKRLDKEFHRVMMLSGVPIYNAQGEVELAVIVSNDITDQIEREKQDKLIQERMEQAQRLESLGVLAGGIAHDFNNLLMAILGHADIALMQLSQQSPVAKNLENIKNASLRAADLCTQLLAYSGQGKIEEKEFSISELAGEMAQMLQTSIAKNCVLNLNLEEQLPMTIGDSSQVRQILMNFVINASDAMGDRHGTIDISTSSINCSRSYFTDDYVIKPLNPGIYVKLEVSDNGPGMNKETLGRIFEPFFSTKFTGRGLGLSAVLGIIRSHGGGLRVHSEPGQGTTFEVFFPALRSRVKKVLASTDGRNPKREHFCGKVLLVDDEEIVCNVCSSQLEMLGLKVLIARNGQEGIDIYRKKQAEIDLVILDLTMPKMGGEETFRILRQLDPQLKIVLASGYTEEDMTTHFSGEKPSGYLRKPYTLKQLSSMLSGLLPDKYTTQ